MPGSTISGTIASQTVTLGSGGYSSPLTITATGAVMPGGNQPGVYLAITGAGGLSGLSVFNDGTIVAPSNDFAGAISLNDGTVSNYSFIEGAVQLYNNGLVTNAGFMSGGGYAAISMAKGGTVSNSGTIQGGEQDNGSAGVVLGGAGTIGNSGIILGGNSAFESGGAGVDIVTGGNLNNIGTISGGTGVGGAAAVDMSGGSISNGGVLFGGFGLGQAGAGVSLSAGGSIDNTGSIIGGTGGTAGSGVYQNGGYVTNSGVVSGGVSEDSELANGVGGAGLLLTGGVFINQATLAGGSGGYGFSGAGPGGAGVSISAGTIVNTGTIEGGVGASGYGASVEFSGIGTLVEDTDGVLLGSLAGFSVGDVIILPSFAESGFSYAGGTGLELDASSATLTLDLMGSFSTSDFVVTDDEDGGTTIALAGTLAPPPNACFTPGTNILTPRGAVAVEALAVGDAVINHAGEDKEIVWIGWRDLDISRHNKPETVRPIIFEAGALAEDVPVRRLVLSPDHALFLDGVLAQAKDLVNGRTIRPDMNARHVRYYHVELAAHDILFAEGAPVESYLDTGHRGVFDNADAPLLLHPELMQMRREAEGCAPLCLGGEKLAAIRQGLARRVLRKVA